MMFGDCALPSNMYALDVIVTLPVAETEFSTMGPVELIETSSSPRSVSWSGTLGVLL